MSVAIGDLVCMYRRKNKGMGLILEKVDDIAAAAGIDSHAVLQDMSEISDWSARTKYKNEVIGSATDPLSAKLFLAFNAQGWCSKPKYQFVRVKWFKPPSNYENKTTSEEVAWYPADWLRKIK